MRIKKPSNSSETIKKIGVFSWSIIGSLIIAALFFYILYLIRIAIIPLLVAMAIAYLLSPLMDLLEKKMRKGFAVTITYIIFIAIVGLTFFFVIPIIIDQFRIFIEKFPSYLENLNHTIENFFDKNILISSIENLTGKEIIAPDTSAITRYFINRFNLENINLLERATVFTRSVVNIVLYLVVGPLLGIYILKDAERLRTVFLKILPRKLRLQASTVMDRINSVAGRYIRGQIMISIIVGILCTIVLLILRVDFAILLGFIAGILNLIPLLGPIIGAIPAALAALFISPLKALLVILLFIAVQQIDNYIITPNVMKYQVRVHPGLIIFSLIVGGTLFGMWGLLLAVPTVAIIQELLKYYLLERNRTASR